MTSKVYYRVQFCTSSTRWFDFSDTYSNIEDAEAFAFEVSSLTSLLSTRVIRIEESICNEFYIEPTLNFK